MNLSSVPLSNPVELVVIINSFNRLPLLREAMQSVCQALETLALRSAIVVFDAGSTDGSVKFVNTTAAQYQTLDIFCLCPPADEDRSFSAGCNAAVHFASIRFPQLKYCLFFETDNLISNPTALPFAIQLLEQEPSLAAVGFTAEKCDGTKVVSGTSFPSLFAFLIGQQLAKRFGLDQLRITNWQPFGDVRWGLSDVMFTSPLLVRYAAWWATKGMDTATFPFSESDNDWCWRVHKQGWKIGVLDVPGVIHDNRTQSSTWSANRVLDFHRGRFYLLKKHRFAGIDWLKPLLFIRHTLEFLWLWIRALRSEQAQKSLSQRWILMKTIFNDYEHS